MLKLKLKVLVILSIVIALGLVQTVRADTYLATIGDIGCKSTALTNLKNIGTANVTFLGLGDYAYAKKHCKALDPLYKNIKNKVGVLGNHECEKGQDPKFAQTQFNVICKKGYFAVRIGNIGIIGINPYTKYAIGTLQYNFIVQKSNEFSNDSSIDWIIYSFHPPVYGIGCSAKHCHNGDSKLQKVVTPLSEKYDAVQVAAHTHLFAVGSPKGHMAVVCGIGGEDGTKLGPLMGYDYASNKMGYCLLHATNTTLTVQQIGSDGTVIHPHNFTR